ncbi:hypothetical protein WICPIJ_000856 [Wickerhamomyces pijperi]|uniref:Uncharacterized protein n=1 Tax=Wickerhamomyces pijperi TaxID=599730 RepID=A0A9P8TS04_WICPI|nr:hypothetical protein WICPIJ_000856 [Wickerhamomyces pijperi]
MPSSRPQALLRDSPCSRKSPLLSVHPQNTRIKPQTLGLKESISHSTVTQLHSHTQTQTLLESDVVLPDLETDNSSQYPSEENSPRQERVHPLDPQLLDSDSEDDPYDPESFNYTAATEQFKNQTLEAEQLLMIEELRKESSITQAQLQESRTQVNKLTSQLSMSTTKQKAKESELRTLKSSWFCPEYVKCLQQENVRLSKSLNIIDTESDTLPQAIDINFIFHPENSLCSLTEDNVQPTSLYQEKYETLRESFEKLHTHNNQLLEISQDLLRKFESSQKQIRDLTSKLKRQNQNPNWGNSHFAKSSYSSTSEPLNSNTNSAAYSSYTSRSYSPDPFTGHSTDTFDTLTHDPFSSLESFDSLDFSINDSPSVISPHLLTLDFKEKADTDLILMALKGRNIDRGIDGDFEVL